MRKGVIINPGLSLTIWVTRGGAEGNHKYGMPFDGCAKTLFLCGCFSRNRAHHLLIHLRHSRAVASMVLIPVFVYENMCFFSVTQAQCV